MLREAKEASIRVSLLLEKKKSKNTAIIRNKIEIGPIPVKQIFNDHKKRT